MKSEKALVAHSRPTLGDPVDRSLPGSSVYGFSKAKILEWVGISFSRIFQTQGSNPDLPVLRVDSLLSESPGKLIAESGIHKMVYFVLYMNNKGRIAYDFRNNVDYKSILPVQFSRSVMSDSLRSHELQQARPPCLSPTRGVHPNFCPSSR